jgi:uncharacterized membrane protein
VISRWQWLRLQLTRRLWFRVAILSVLAAAAALIGVAPFRFVPDRFSALIGAGAINNILHILATSMLAVTTFALTAMVSAFGAVTSNATPRAARLLKDDSTTQNLLGTFIGSFVYSLIGIIALSTGAYGGQGRVILFVVTLLVIGLIVISLLRWIEYLSSLGRIGETVQRVENVTLEALTMRVRHPYMGCHPLRNPGQEIPSEAVPVYSETIGYVQYVNVEQLSSIANGNKGRVFLTALPGTFIDTSRPLMYTVDLGDEKLTDELKRGFTVRSERTFEQDPRFGLIVLGEIASRALSPAVNDPGTAIDVIGRAVRILSAWAQDQATEACEDVLCPGVWVPALSIGDLLDDIFTPIARDGASNIEVQIRLQKALRSLSQAGHGGLRECALYHSRLALQRAEANLNMDFEKDSIRKLAHSFAAS